MVKEMTASQIARVNERWKEAVACIGNDNYVNPNQRRAQELGLQTDKDGNFQGFGAYMHAKQAKLHQQVNTNMIKKSDIFKGLSFYVDGHCHPPASEILVLVTTHGGDYHHYYKHGHTSYVVAEALANTKKERLRKDEKVIKPTFITDSIAAGKLLPESNYFLLAEASVNHVQEFFNRSRLHLISTMATELKKFVAELRARKNTHVYTSREKLKHLKSSVKFPESLICHIDMDSFFVSVALRTRPELKGKPVAVTHSSGHNSNAGYGEIASCSYEAREKGCYARQFVRDAKLLCPDLVCVPYQFDDYVAVAKQLYKIISTYTLDIKAVSCDELYFDLGSICHECDINDPLAVITIIRNDILEATNCIASAGIGCNSLIARLCTKKAKPNGQKFVPIDEAKEFVKGFPISDLPNVGWTMNGNIQDQFGADVKTCRQLHAYPIEDLQRVLGYANGEKVYRALRGQAEPIDFEEVLDQKSVSVNCNFGIRWKTQQDVKTMLRQCANELSTRLKNINKTTMSVSIRFLIRKPDAPLSPAKHGAHGPCDAIRKTTTIPQSAEPDVIYNGAMKMYTEMKPVISDIRGVSLQCTRLITFAPNRATTSIKGAGTLWDYMNLQPNVAKNAEGETTTNVGAFQWMPKVKPPPGDRKKPKNNHEVIPAVPDINGWSPIKEQDEMRMKISDVINTVPVRQVKRRKLGKLRPAPVYPKHVHNYSHHYMGRDTVNIAGIGVKFVAKPTEKNFRTLMFHFKNFVSTFQFGDLKKIFATWVRYVSDPKKNSPAEWQPLVAQAKRYLNWYCYNHHNGKVFPYEEGPNDDEEFKRFTEDLIRELTPKQHREPSPDMFASTSDAEGDAGNEGQKADGSSQECEVIAEGDEECMMVPGPSKVVTTKPAATSTKAPTSSTVSKTATTNNKPTSKAKLTTTKSSKTAKKLDSTTANNKRKQPTIEELLKNQQIPRKKTRIQQASDDDCCVLDYQPPITTID